MKMPKYKTIGNGLVIRGFNYHSVASQVCEYLIHKFKYKIVTSSNGMYLEKSVQSGYMGIDKANTSVFVIQSPLWGGSGELHHVILDEYGRELKRIEYTICYDAENHQWCAELSPWRCYYERKN